METKFNFNSQVCTSRSQSERLLALGLKKETADMTWHFSYMMKGEPQYDLLAESTWDEDTIQRYVENGVKMTLFDHWKHSDGTQMTPLEIYAEITKKDIPAWSLARIVELMPQIIGHFELAVNDAFVGYYENRCESESGMYWEHTEESSNLYDNIISTIEWLIKEGYFNKEYLV